MTFEAHKRYKHVNNTDVVLEVRDIIYQDSIDATLVVAWWNIKTKPKERIVPHQIVYIKPEQMGSWKEFV